MWVSFFVLVFFNQADSFVASYLSYFLPLEGKASMNIYKKEAKIALRSGKRLKERHLPGVIFFSHKIPRLRLTQSIQREHFSF